MQVEQVSNPVIRDFLLRIWTKRALNCDCAYTNHYSKATFWIMSDVGRAWQGARSARANKSGIGSASRRIKKGYKGQKKKTILRDKSEVQGSLGVILMVCCSYFAGGNHLFEELYTLACEGTS